jgi:hypothetical protein
VCVNYIDVFVFLRYYFAVILNKIIKSSDITLYTCLIDKMLQKFTKSNLWLEKSIPCSVRNIFKSINPRIFTYIPKPLVQKKYYKSFIENLFCEFSSEGESESSKGIFKTLARLALDL